jgi:hypothetical protein
MADMTIDDVVKELDTFLSNNPTLISAAINRAQNILDLHTQPLTKVKGNYPQGHTLLSDVVQGFDPVWNDLGTLQIEHKILKNYHQKVNFGLIPSQILASYWAELYAEERAPEDMPISRYIIENELLPKVLDNLATLSVTGKYDAARKDEFGYSMNGIKTIIDNLLAANVATAPTPYKIPLDAATDLTIVETVTNFERSLPSKMKSKIKKLYFGENFAERHMLDYEDKFGQNKFQNDQMKTRLGKREIVIIPGYEGDQIFAHVEGNFKRLIDVFDGAPAVTDIQKQDYKIKIFMEFWKGYDFLIDELVFVSNYADETLGLGSTAKNQKYYGFDGVTA